MQTNQNHAAQAADRYYECCFELEERGKEIKPIITEMDRLMSDFKKWERESVSAKTAVEKLAAFDEARGFLARMAELEPQVNELSRIGKERMEELATHAVTLVSSDRAEEFLPLIRAQQKAFSKDQWKRIKRATKSNR